MRIFTAVWIFVCLQTAIDRRGSRTSKRAKLVFVAWKGRAVPVSALGRAAGSKTKVQALFKVR